MSEDFDFTRMMLNKLRSLQEQDIRGGEEKEGEPITDDEQKEEEELFKGKVSKMVKFDPIRVYDENVEWGGFLIRERLYWIYSLDDTVGCYVRTDDDDLLQLRDEVLEVVKKIRGYYDVWSDEWSSRLLGSNTDNQGDEGEEESEIPGFGI